MTRPGAVRPGIGKSSSGFFHPVCVMKLFPVYIGNSENRVVSGLEFKNDFEQHSEILIVNYLSNH
jgi:hypothetical protein